MTIVNYLLCIITSPGKVIKNWEKNKDLEKDLKYQINKQQFFCKNCSMNRPERSHHCKVCKMCVMKMDHHCPWIANCVGFYNQKYFYLFIFYATLGNIIIATSLGLEIGSGKFLSNQNYTTNTSYSNSYNYIDIGKVLLINNTNITLTHKNVTNLMNFTTIISYFSDQILIIVGCSLSGIMTILIGILFANQTYLIINNLTSIEKRIYKKTKENPFYTNDKILSLSIVLGFNKLLWFLPIFKKNIYNYGYSFSKPTEKIVQINEPEGNFHSLPLEADLTSRSSKIKIGPSGNFHSLPLEADITSRSTSKIKNGPSGNFHSLPFEADITSNSSSKKKNDPNFNFQPLEADISSRS